ncbi:reverse transcriptase [Brachionus plicatilis]|uniref:Reverse transcriptase n=1 Tax=Brachionus plicatilis TaxID=10195 RepID=A0A3M7Q5V8_BRAPC|nr:reverse transcriptase [Brachionus plicatilis]
MFYKINWDELRNRLSRDQSPNCTPLSTEVFDKAASKLTNNIQKALVKSTTSFTINNPTKLFCSVPQHLLELIYFKRRIKKTFQKSQLPEHKKILNAANYKLSKQLKKLKLEKLKNEFIELSNFNQSDSRHWKLINKLESENSKKQVNITLRVDNTTISNPQDVAEIFAENLAQTFTDRNPDLHEVTPISDTRNFGLKEYISTNDLVNATNKITNKKSSGFDGADSELSDQMSNKC